MVLNDGLIFLYNIILSKIFRMMEIIETGRQFVTRDLSPDFKIGET